MRKRTERNSGAGFTLIELLIVVAIIGLVAAIAIPNLFNALDKSRQTATIGLMRSYGMALEAYNADNQRYPQANDIHALVPLLQPLLKTPLPAQDHWHKDLDYRSDLDGYTIESFGKDGVNGANVTPETRYVFTLDIVYVNGTFVNGAD